jgi:EF-hand domain pair
MTHAELSPVQAQKLTTLFRHYDRDGDGQITLADYRGVATRFAASMGWSTDGERATQLVERRSAAFQKLRSLAGAEADSISLEGFLTGYARQIKLAQGGAVPELKLECPELLSVLEREQFAVLTLSEYKAFLVDAMGADVDCAAAFQRLDRDDDGALILSDLEALALEFLTSGNADDAGNLLYCGKI